MNTSLSKRFVALVAMLALVPLTHAAALKVGDAFPQLSGYELEGRLPELEGKVVLVDFWASWCAPCKQSFPALNELQKRFGKDGVVILGISVDEQRAAMDKFLKGTPAEFSIVRDAKQKLVAAVSVDTMPTSFIVDRKGRVRFLHSGYHGADTKRAYEKELQEVLKEKP